MAQSINSIDKQFYGLGTVNYIKVYDCPDENILQLAVNRVNEIEARMSAFLSDSDISRINQYAGSELVPIHPETMELLKNAMRYAELSGGAFDITVRPLVELWGIGKKNNYIPSEQKILQTLKLVNAKDLIINQELGLAGLKNSGQKIDLGGIAKGYAADEVKRILHENNIKNALINLGGNVLTMGHRPDEEQWKIGVQNPLSPTGNYLGVLNVSEKTIVTSGSNERFFIKDGIRYHHILDPRSGKPTQTGLLSVTVVSDTSLEADVITTALFVMGLEKGIAFLREFAADAIFITENLGIYLTEGIVNQFTISGNPTGPNN